MEDEVLFTVNDGIATITLNRPKRKNAINQALLTGLYNKIEYVAIEDDIKAAIITGSEKAFCSGVDLTALEKGENLFNPRGDGKGMVEIFNSCNKPVIGAVNGYAITGGFEIALNCDFLIASENAVFKDTHALVGIHPGWGMSQLLSQAVGRRMAKQISMTCEGISAQKALMCGLVNEVVPFDELMKRTNEIAKMIVNVNQDIMLKMKNLCELGDYKTIEEGLQEEKKGFKNFLAQFEK
jgi:enoyl-CoA hydratase